ncbi:MAG: acyl-ACP--UDP-N-acetylglucosamine O-acyltransferase [Alphaproteobacteria bacterium]
MTTVHPTAIVSPGAEIDATAKIGPYCVVGEKVKIAEGVQLRSHVVVDGATEIGPHATIFPFASIGLQPQDLKYEGENSRLVIGANAVIREHATLNTGTKGGGMLTQVGDNCLIMVGAHVAHDCKVGNNVILANNATLAGHVEVGDYAILGGLSAVHQFVRIGRHAMVGGMTGVENDVIPYGSVTGNRAHLSGLNIIGLKRRGFSREAIHDLRHAYRVLFAPDGTLQDRLSEVERTYAGNDVVMEIVAFVQSDSSRAICQPQAERAA